MGIHPFQPHPNFNHCYVKQKTDNNSSHKHTHTHPHTSTENERVSERVKVASVKSETR